MKNIGIITYHHYNNYGTMLQAYALQHYISSIGYNAELIDFLQSSSMSKLDMIKLRFRRLPTYIVQHKKYTALAAARSKKAEVAKLFEAFYKEYLVVGKEYYVSSQQLINNPPVYDGYVVGSDQTWNPNVAYGPEAFFLTFVKDDNKKGCYAPSIGLSSLSDEQKVKYRNLLKGFRYLSCREKLGSEILSDATGRHVEWVLDPTLLLKPEEWDTISSVCRIKQPYILTYFLGEVKEHRIFVEKLAKQTGLQVVSLPASYLETQRKDWNQEWVGPDKFLYLIKNASYVCTDSFHGTAFAINYHTPFFSFCKRKDTEGTSDNSRLYSILQLFQLTDRMVTDCKLPDNIEMGFEESERILTKKRNDSEAYLKSMLSSFS